MIKDEFLKDKHASIKSAAYAIKKYDEQMIKDEDMKKARDFWLDKIADERGTVRGEGFDEYWNDFVIDIAKALSEAREQAVKEFVEGIRVICLKYDNEHGRFPEHEREGESVYYYIKQHLLKKVED